MNSVPAQKHHSFATFWPAEWRIRLGLFGLLLFAFSAWFGPAPANIALALMLAAALMEWRQSWHVFRHDLIFWPTLILLGYIFLRAALAAQEMPELAEEQWKTAWNFASLGLFLLPAYWLARCPDKRGWVLALAVAGLIIGLGLNQDWSKWELMLQGQRSGAEKWHYSIMGLYAVTALLGLLLFAPRLLYQQQSRRLKTAVTIAWLVCTIIIVHAFIVSQTRAVWFAAPLVFPPIFFFFIRGWLKAHPDFSRKKLALVAIAGVTLISGVFVANFETISKRATQEGAVYEGISKLEELSTESVAKLVPQSSFGARFWLLSYGLELWKERPWLGWGPGTSSTRDLAPLRDRQDLVVFWHLHNGYLEVLYRFGLVGAVLFALPLLLVIRATYRAHRRGEIPDDLYLLLAGALFLTLIWNLTTVRLDKFDYRVYWYFLAGIAYASTIRQSLASYRKHLTST